VQDEFHQYGEISPGRGPLILAKTKEIGSYENEGMIVKKPLQIFD
jgi:hypothetical protein